MRNCLNIPYAVFSHLWRLIEALQQKKKGQSVAVKLKVDDFYIFLALGEFNETYL